MTLPDAGLENSTYTCGLPENSTCTGAKVVAQATGDDADDAEARISLPACQRWCSRNAQAPTNGCNFDPWKKRCHIVRHCVYRRRADFKWGGTCKFARRIDRFRAWAKEQFEDGGRGRCHSLRSISDYTHCKGRRVVGFVGSTQRLQSDFTSVCRLLKIPGDKCADLSALPRHCLNSCSKVARVANDDTSTTEYAAAHQDRLRLADAYDDATRSLVARAWAQDIELFNFSWAEAVASDV